MEERALMAQVAEIAQRRIESLGLKGKAALRDTDAVLQGACTVAMAAGLMTVDRAAMISFLVSVGRIDTILKAA